MSKQKKTGNMKKVGLIALAIVIALVIIGLNVWNYIQDSGFMERRTVAIKTDNFEVSESQMSYYFYTQYMNTYNSLASYGLDPSVYGLVAGQSLKTQKSTFDSTRTWFQYFMESAMDSVKDQLYLCEAAKAAGIGLDDKDYEEIDAIIDSMEATAKSNGYSLSSYIKSSYGTIVSESDIRDALAIELLATKYLEGQIEKADISDETVQKIYDDDKDSYDTVDYLTFTFDYEDIYDVLIAEKNGGKKDSTTTDNKDKEIDPEVKAQAVEVAETYAKKLANTSGLYGFEKTLEDFYIKVMKMSEETAKKTLAEGAHIAKGAYYKEGDEQLAWMFGKDDKSPVSTSKAKLFTKTEDHEHKEGDDHSDLAEIYTVVLVTRTRGIVEDTYSVDVRHILFTTDKYKTDAEAKKVYEQWKKDGAKAEDFEALAYEYSEDTGSKFDGGLYEGVTEGQMVKEFDAWIFDEARKEGDHAIVKTSYGWHLMYFEGSSKEWQATIKTNIRTEASEMAVEDATEKYQTKVTINYDAINDIDA